MREEVWEKRRAENSHSCKLRIVDIQYTLTMRKPDPRKTSGQSRITICCRREIRLIQMTRLYLFAEGKTR